MVPDFRAMKWVSKALKCQTSQNNSSNNKAQILLSRVCIMISLIMSEEIAPSSLTLDYSVIKSQCMQISTL